MKSFLIISILTISVQAFTQENNKRTYKRDLTISLGKQFSHQSFERIGMQYGEYLNDQWRLKFSFYYGQLNFDSYTGAHPVFYSDSIMILRERIMDRNNFMVKLGIDRMLSNYFFAGAEINLNYWVNNFVNKDKGLRYLANEKVWDNCSDCLYEYHNIGDAKFDQDSNSPRYYYSSDGKSTNLFYGLSLSAGVKYPINKKLEAIIQYNPEALFYNSSDKSGLSFLGINHVADMMIRYKI